MLAKHKIAFHTASGYTNYITSNRILLRNITLSKIFFIIGLNFLPSDQYGLIILRIGIYILHEPFLPSSSEFASKRGGPCPCKTPGQCKQTVDISEEITKEFELLEDNYIAIESM